MDLPSQPPSSEGTEQPPRSSEEALIQPSPVANSLPEETSQSVNPTTEDVPTQITPTADSLPEETQQQHEDPVVEDTPTEFIAASETSQDEETEQQSVASLDQDGDETSDEDEDLDEDELEGTAPAKPGVFIGRGLLIAAACAIVVVALMAALLIVVSRPKDPPTDWIASYTPTPVAGTASSGKILYYLHWTNQNGALQGQLQLATISNGTLQSATAPTTGLYSKDNHIIYVVITLSGQVSTLTGKINDASDTLTLNSPGAASPGSGLVFHIGSANDYKQATKKLGSKK